MTRKHSTALMSLAMKHCDNLPVYIHSMEEQRMKVLWGLSAEDNIRN